MNMAPWTLWASLLAVLLMGAARGAAAPAARVSHPAHYTMTQMQYRPERAALEVSFALPNGDLEAALRELAGREVDLDDDDDGARWARKYACAKLRLEIAGRAQQLHWVGLEKGERSSWLHFEFRGLRSLGGARFVHDALFELDEEEYFHVTELRRPGGQGRETLRRKTLSRKQRGFDLD